MFFSNNITNYLLSWTNARPPIKNSIIHDGARAPTWLSATEKWPPYLYLYIWKISENGRARYIFSEIITRVNGILFWNENFIAHKFCKVYEWV